MRRVLLLVLGPLFVAAAGCGDEPPKPQKPNDAKGEGVARWRPGDDKSAGGQGVPKGVGAPTKD